MELILWRHAEAEDGYPDLARKLTGKGHQQAKKMAAWLHRNMPKDIRILVSPATRTQETVAALELPYTIVEDLAPGAAGHQILALTEWSNSKGAVLVVGHQPGLGIAAALAMTSKPHYWSIKKGNVWWLASRVRAEEEQAIIRAVVSPEYL